MANTPKCPIESQGVLDPLAHDAVPIERQAIAAGWSRDGDGWWVRPSREGDPAEADFFSVLKGFIDEDGVYCCSAAVALAFDERKKPGTP